MGASGGLPRPRDRDLGPIAAACGGHHSGCVIALACACALTLMVVLAVGIAFAVALGVAVGSTAVLFERALRDVLRPRSVLFRSIAGRVRSRGRAIAAAVVSATRT